MGNRTAGKPKEDALAECEETVEHLREENAELRESAQTFGDLAERLNNQRRDNDKRHEPQLRKGRSRHAMNEQ